MVGASAQFFGASDTGRYGDCARLPSDLRPFEMLNRLIVVKVLKQIRSSMTRGVRLDRVPWTAGTRQIGLILSNEKSELKKLQDLSDRLDKAREAQRAAAAQAEELTRTQRDAAKQVAAARETTARVKKRR